MEEEEKEIDFEDFMEYLKAVGRAWEEEKENKKKESKHVAI